MGDGRWSMIDGRPQHELTSAHLSKAFKIRWKCRRLTVRAISLTPAFVVSTISVTIRFARTVAISESYRQRLKYLAIEWLCFRWTGVSMAAK